METKDLINSTLEQSSVSENTVMNTDLQISENTSNEVKNTTENTSEQKKESAADLILKKFAERKKQSGETSEDKVKTDDSQGIKLEEIAKEIEEKGIKADVVEEEITEEDEEHADEHETISSVDYSNHSKAELVTELKILVEKSVTEIKGEVEAIKTNFYKKHKAEIAEIRRKFVEEGGFDEEFKIEADPLEQEFKDLYKQYRDKKSKHNEEIEAQKNKNLHEKNQIIEEIKNLINSQESLDITFENFRNLQKRWREIGAVPQNNAKELWDTYHHHVEKFYHIVKIDKELRDLDLRKNLEAKIELCERAEDLLLEPKIVKAFKSLQKLHEQWREIGPVPIEKKDEIWERFKNATSKINKKHQEHFEGLKAEQENNLKAKTILCEKAEELASAANKTHKDWENSSKEIIELQKIWKLIGFAPKKDNNRIYTRFRSACDLFFEKKRDFYAQSKDEQEKNLEQKTNLCLQAESLKTSTEWKKATDIFINLQKQWKTIGPVPKKYSDDIWKRFRAACNEFFDNKSKHFASIDAEQDANLTAKRNLIEEVKNFVHVENDEENLHKLKEFQKRWTEIGHVPIKFKDELQKQFRTEIDKHFTKMRLDDHKRDENRFKTRIDSLRNQPQSYDKIRAEKEKIRTRIDQIQSKIVLWENNLGFFAKSKNAESMMAEFQKKIESAKDQIKSLKKQIELIDKPETEKKQ